MESEKVLDTISKIKIIKLEHSVAAVISANYMKKFAAKSGMKKTYFTPDEKTIKYIEKRLPETQGIIDKVWGDSDSQKLLKFDAKHMDLYDKQYGGYVNSKKDSIVSIQLLNFESDPYHQKPKMGKEIIGGGGGWFNTNTCYFEYNMQSKKFNNFQ